LLLSSPLEAPAPTPRVELAEKMFLIKYRLQSYAVIPWKYSTDTSYDFSAIFLLCADTIKLAGWQDRKNHVLFFSEGESVHEIHNPRLPLMQYLPASCPKDSESSDNTKII